MSYNNSNIIISTPLHACAKYALHYTCTHWYFQIYFQFSLSSEKLEGPFVKPCSEMREKNLKTFNSCYYLNLINVPNIEKCWETQVKRTSYCFAFAGRFYCSDDIRSQIRMLQLGYA